MFLESKECEVTNKKENKPSAYDLSFSNIFGLRQGRQCSNCSRADETSCFCSALVDY
jgi:hypothetical protein